MSSRSQRRRNLKHAHIVSFVVAGFMFLAGIYFMTGIRAQTEAKNAECTKKTTGVVSDVKVSGSKFLTTIDYTAEDVDTSVTVETGKDLGVGSEIEVLYEPLSIKHIYIDGISQTGADDIKTGSIIFLVGIVFIAYGLFEKKRWHSKSSDMTD